MGYTIVLDTLDGLTADRRRSVQEGDEVGVRHRPLRGHLIGCHSCGVCWGSHACLSVVPHSFVMCVGRLRGNTTASIPLYASA